MIDFLKKYKIIIFLMVLVFILGFLKIYYNNQTKKEEIIKEKDTEVEEKEINEEIFLVKEKLGEKKWNEYIKIETEEEFTVFWETLNEEQKEILTQEEIIEE
jgi:hypothetical protein